MRFWAKFMKQLHEFEETIGIHFHDKQLLRNALIHRSYLNENKHLHLASNEKLEFLGDSILSLITSLYLYNNYPHLQEGEYTDIKAAIVKTESLFESAARLQLDEYLYLSRGERKNKDTHNKSILADCFEAVIASIFLDRGFDASYQFVLRFLFASRLDVIINRKLYLSPKNRLQEYWQNTHKKLPQYRMLSQKGPEHQKKYRIAVFLNNKNIAEGEGESKKEAEEQAARAALQKIGV